jgi:uncharacterized protein DUF4333
MYEDNAAATPPSYVWPASLMHPPTPQRNSTSAMAVASLVLSLVALLGVVVIALLLMADGASVPDEGEGVRSGGPLTGRVPNLSAGAALRGTVLAASVTDRIHIDGGDVSDMTCPDTPRVDQGVVSVCHGWIDDEQWAVVVYFEDDGGKFTLEPI